MQKDSATFPFISTLVFQHLFTSLLLNPSSSASSFVSRLVVVVVLLHFSICFDDLFERHRPRGCLGHASLRVAQLFWSRLIVRGWDISITINRELGSGFISYSASHRTCQSSRTLPESSRAAPHSCSHWTWPGSSRRQLTGSPHPLPDRPTGSGC